MYAVKPWFVFVFGATLLGCGDAAPPAEPATNNSALPPIVYAPAVPSAEQMQAEAQNRASAAATQTPAPVAAEPTREVAAAGVGKKGQGYGGGIVTEPIRVRFRAEQTIIFNNVQYALKLYKAEHGQGPRSQEEFMEKIIKDNNIQLPELPVGDRYVYDVEAEQLMVEHPAAP